MTKSKEQNAKKRNELHIFNDLAKWASLAVTPMPIKQPDPPAPDIECEILGSGKLAVELVALDDVDTIKNRSIANDIENAWNRALTNPPSNQDWFTTHYSNVYIYLRIGFLQKNDLTGLMRGIQERLILRGQDFKGEIRRSVFPIIGPDELPDGCDEIQVIRGDDIVDGPRINASFVDSCRKIQVNQIRKKLTEREYQTDAPRELFAYTLTDEVAGHIDSLSELEQCIRLHLQQSKFQRVRIFCCTQRKEVLTISRAELCSNQ